MRGWEDKNGKIVTVIVSLVFRGGGFIFMDCSVFLCPHCLPLHFGADPLALLPFKLGNLKSF